MCNKWGANRLKRFDKIYDPLKSRAELMDEVPTGISMDEWISYVDYSLKEKTMVIIKVLQLVYAIIWNLFAHHNF